MNRFVLPVLFLFSIVAITTYACTKEITPSKYLTEIITVEPEGAAARAAKIRAETAVEVAEGLDLSLWAADSIVADPIALSVAPDGRVFYTSAKRQKNSEFDIRGHRDWMTASLSFQTIEDRRDFLHKTFTADSEQSEAHLKDLNEDGVLDWKDLTVEQEQVWFVTDANSDGVADRAQRFLTDFDQEITDVANGIEYHNGEVYISVGPDLWRAKDADGDGTADDAESLSHGYIIHVGFSGHGMSGVTVGPQGRIWWGAGDVGMNVVDQEGKNWKYPNRGVVVRCEPDGSNFEVFAMGVRNTHEFAFDNYGNLITVDNDGDHAGERERLVYLIDGSDTGWRINWQFGKYTDPKNNAYKVWMDEGMHLPRHDEQAAYFLPPIQNFVNGPTGLVFNPGTALNPDYYDHFFVAEFRGSPGNSPVHAFTMEPDGAGFKLGKSEAIVSGLLPTGMDFGADGALYFGDWLNGWGPKQEGRIWKLDAGANAGAEIGVRQSTQALLQEDFSGKAGGELAGLLGHQDRRVRQEAQFALAERGEDGFKHFEKFTMAGDNHLARIHALWGMAQMIRRGYETENPFRRSLQDSDPEMIAQAAKLIGDLKLTDAEAELIALLKHDSPRIRFFAMEALGRTEAKAAVPGILELVRENDGKDMWLRHGAMVALGRIGDDAAMANLAAAPSQEVRLTAIVALRRMESPSVKAFLNDEEEYVVAEAARAINDDFQIPGAMSNLAGILNKRSWESEALIRRIINASITVGNDRTAQALITYANTDSNPTAMRAEALAALGHWAKPSLFDRVDGRYRGERNKDATFVKQQLGTIIPDLIAKGETDIRKAAIAATAGLKLMPTVDQLSSLLSKDADPEIRAASLTALKELEAPGLEKLLRTAMNDRNNSVRSRALALLPNSSIAPAEATKLYADIIESGTTEEAQGALSGLGQLDAPPAEALLSDLLDQLMEGKLAAPIQLDLVEAIELRDSSALTARLVDYEASLMTDANDLGLFATALSGGNARAGRGVFYWNSSGQCTRCHAIFEYGGNVGPNLQGVGSRLSPEEILTSVVRPSAALAQGHETVLVTLKDESALSGIVLERTPEYLKVKVGKTDNKTIPTADIEEVETLPSSMPSAEGVLTRREIRDLVAFLVREKGEVH